MENNTLASFAPIYFFTQIIKVAYSVLISPFATLKYVFSFLTS